MKATLVVLILLVQVGLAQDIVLKSTYPVQSYNGTFVSVLPLRSIDVDNDGIAEILYRGTSGSDCAYLNTVTGAMYGPPCMLSYPATHSFATQMRANGVAEWVNFSSCSSGSEIIIRDIATYDVLFVIPTLGAPSSKLFIYDYDTDGLEDVIVMYWGNAYVFGVANGNPVSPPQDLNIQVSGDDYLISWNSVQSATAYRVLWSSSIDGTSFTRIGYTTATTFTHRHQADQPRGFYRVMSEDNGTGVVRMVGQTTTGER